MTALGIAAPFSLSRRVGVGVAACAFVGAIAWQVIAQRDDWPLSCFEMYSNIEGRVAWRSFVRGVSDQGEFELVEGVLPVSGARLRTLNAKLARHKSRQRRFAALIHERYDARPSAKGDVVLQAVRAYKERWTIRQGLVAIDRPKRRMTGVLYLPPPALLARLALERSGEAQAAAPRPVAEGDVVIDLDASVCGTGCEVIDDRLAASGHALRLSARAAADDDGEATLLSLPLSLPAGRWSLLLRMRTPVRDGTDQLRATLDGERLGGKAGLGNYARALDRGAWVWASRTPGQQTLSFEAKGESPHILTLRLSQHSMELDELWLSRARRELPIWNEPVSP